MTTGSFPKGKRRCDSSPASDVPNRKRSQENKDSNNINQALDPTNEAGQKKQPIARTHKELNTLLFMPAPFGFCMPSLNDKRLCPCSY